MLNNKEINYLLGHIPQLCEPQKLTLWTVSHSPQCVVTQMERLGITCQIFAHPDSNGVCFVQVVVEYGVLHPAFSGAMFLLFTDMGLLYGNPSRFTLPIFENFGGHSVIGRTFGSVEHDKRLIDHYIDGALRCDLYEREEVEA